MARLSTRQGAEQHAGARPAGARPAGAGHAGARHVMLRGALAGLGLGLLWGVAARVWMRLMNPTSPEFSWAGTLMILTLAALLGLGVGLLAAAKVKGARRWWRLAVVPGLLIFASQGLLFLPAFALGGLVLTRRHWALRALGAAASVAMVVVLGVLLGGVDEETMTTLPTSALVSGVVGFVLLSAAMAAAGSVLYRPWAPRTRSASIAPMGSAEVAAGEGALAT
jgi:hypothetical protein